jgi:pimeloyl-ACP methyl ester carboxylesterase
MATFVLVHGGGHGAWCWERIVPLLAVKGHRVETPVLTGVGERAAELTAGTDLSTHIADVVALIEGERLTDVILVGHSYGCMVITGVAGRVPGRIAELVFLDGPHPRDGESLVDASPGAGPALEWQKQVVGGVELVLFPTPEILALYGIVTPDDLVWAAPRLTPHPLRSFHEKLRLADPAAVARIPRTAIDCTESLARRDPVMFARARESDRCWEIDTGHDLMISEPERTATMLLRVAADPAGKSGGRPGAAG